MITVPTITDAYFRWMDAVAARAVGLLTWLSPPPVVRLREDETGNFIGGADLTTKSINERKSATQADDSQMNHALLAGGTGDFSNCHVELVLRQERFLLRPLELPAKAAEFLDGIVRAQLDRLTPWTATDATFGWTKPAPSALDRIVITVVAGAREHIAPLVETALSRGARSITLFAELPLGADTSLVKVFHQTASGTMDITRIRRALASILAAAGLMAGIAIGASAVITLNLDGRQEELRREIAQARGGVSANGTASSSPIADLQQSLAARKQQEPARVILLEDLSRILPDHTYVTEMRMEGNKVQLSGLTHDAPGLIRLLEESNHFGQATFFAPTTRSPPESGDRFHVEVQVQSLVRR